MVDYGTIRSTVRPEPKVIDDFSVWINTDVHEITVDMEGEQHTEFEFNQVQYSKEEYIQKIDSKNSELESNLTNTQIALCEVYEMLG